MGRKSKYPTNIEPYLDKIKQYKKQGATDEQICRIFNVSRTQYYDYMKKYPNFSKAVKVGVEEFVQELRGRLASLTEPHKLETKKTYIKVDTETGNKTQYTEITTRDVDPDVSAIHLLLKNLDHYNWANDPQQLSIHKQELELRKAIAKSNNFDLELDEDNKK